MVKVDIDGNHFQLTIDEKKTMFKKHLPDEKPTKQVVNKMSKIDIYFPCFVNCLGAK